MTDFRVLVTAEPFGARAPLSSEGCDITWGGESMEPDELRRVLGTGIDGWIAGCNQITPYVLENANQLRVISRVGVGVDGIDFDTCEERGIIVTHTPHAPSVAVAELTVGLILCLTRNIVYADQSMRMGYWAKGMGSLLSSKTVGIVGVGRIGSQVARILSAFCCQLLGHDIEPDPTVVGTYGLQYVDKKTILLQSDILTLHLPLNDSTRGWLGYDELVQMKETAYLVNTSRGDIIDEAALLKVLLSGQIARAALDVYSQEPYQGPLASLGNVVLTCHMGAAAKEARQAMEARAVEDCLRVLNGQHPLRLVLERERR